MSYSRDVDAELAADSVPFIEEEAGARQLYSQHQLGWRGAAGVSAALLGVAAFAGMSARRAAAGGAAGALIGLDAEAEAPACVAEGQNCLSSKCCLAGGSNGMMCYAKSDFWAECHESCEPGVHEGEKHGTYDQYGKFQLDSWSCKELGERSEAGCEAFEHKSKCPSGRCGWVQGSCQASCSLFADADGCGTQHQCMWKGKCMQACDTFESEEACGPSDQCQWKDGKCMEGCWTFGDWNSCSHVDRCSWDGKECKDNCWTYGSQSTCGEHSGRCMWHGEQCKPACATFGSKDACPRDMGCMWTKKDMEAAKCTVDPCGIPGEDCRSSRCCSSERGAGGMTCYSKDENWASCSSGCDPNGGETEGWKCKALGNRSLIPPGCAWAGKNCEVESLCCNVGFNCLVKDDMWTACVQTVEKTTWVTKKVPLPGGWKGTFVGPGRTEYSVPAVGEGQPTAGTSLYCFMAILPGSSEVTLMNLAKRTKSSIFACDYSDVFHSWQSAKSGWDTGEATLTNTDVFINVWQQVNVKGMFRNYDWTVKVDADAILIPGRLKAHIQALRPPPYRAIYLKNNAMDPGMGNNGFLGAVEVFSKLAVEVYFDNAEGCKTSLGLQAGEDGFFKGCMDAIGVGYMVDAQLFNPDISPGICNNEGRAAFHPLKDPVNWQCCLDIVNGKPHNVEYGHCTLGYDLDLNFDDDQ